MALTARVAGGSALPTIAGFQLSEPSRVEVSSRHQSVCRGFTRSRTVGLTRVSRSHGALLSGQRYGFFGSKCEGQRLAVPWGSAHFRLSVQASVAEPPVKQAVDISVSFPSPELLSVFDSPSPFVISSPSEPQGPVYPTLPTGDSHRPTYHFQPPAGFMNDPNGPAFIGGQYHIFYQHNPQRAAWNWGVCWGHAVSSDLVHWEHRPLALTPTPGGYDQDGVFSGCCVNNDGIPTLLYTGVQVATPDRPVNVTSVSQLLGAAFSEVQCVATLGADGKFSKGLAPVISAPPAGLDIVGFRDPYVWREGDEWMMVLGSGIKEQGGTALLYKSPDLHQWEFVQPIHIGDHTETGTMWECPLLLKLGKWHILSVSPDNPANPILYWIGSFSNGTFVPYGAPRRLDLGNVCYAPNSCVDGKGRQLVWAWIQEVRSEEASVAAGYAGCLTLPRVLSMLDDGRLVQEPVEEMTLLRDRHLVHETDFALASKRPRSFNVHTGTLEIEAEIERGGADAVGIDIRETPTEDEVIESECGEEECGLEATRAQRVLRTDPHEGVLVSYDYKRQWLEVAWWQPGPDAGPDSPGELVSKGGPLELDEGENLKLRVFLDQSVVEVFANNRAVLTTRMYRSVVGVAMIAKGGDARVKQVDMWQMGSMWDLQLEDSPFLAAQAAA